MNRRLRRETWVCALLVLLAARTTAAQVLPATGTMDAQSAVANQFMALPTGAAATQDIQMCSATQSCSVAQGTCGECRSGGLYAGAAVVYAKPHFKEAFQATYMDASGVFHMVPFSYDYDPTPRVWLGYTGCDGLGLRSRYWQYDNSAAPFQSDPYTAAQAHVVSIIFPATISATPPGQVLTVADDLEVHTLDLEGTQEVCVGGLPVVLSGGIRYAMMQQQTAAAVTGGEAWQSLTWQRRFEGIGPVVAAEVERPIGCRGLAFIGAFRGSLLFGDKDLDRIELYGSGGGPPVVSLDKASEVLGIGEIELGVQWSRQLPGGGSLFVRGTYEGQLWSDSGTPTLGYLGFQGFGLGLGLAR